MSSPEPSYEPCAQCHAGLEQGQRYCVNCGARNVRASDPALRHLAAATRRARPTRTRAPRREGSAARAALVVFFVLLPAAVAVGVLVGHGSGRDDSKLLEALRHQTGIAGSSGGAALASASTRVASDFTLPHGFTVKLQLLPIGGTDQAAANAAKKAADAKGATKAGIIDPADFRTTPDQGKQGYVLYSGEFETRAKAQRELTRLRGKFKGAEVIAVASTSKAGKVLAKSQFGAIHQVAGFTASPQKIRHDAPIVRRIATQTGKDYIQAQRNLPDVITVGGDGSGGGPTTGGD